MPWKNASQPFTQSTSPAKAWNLVAANTTLFLLLTTQSVTVVMHEYQCDATPLLFSDGASAEAERAGKLATEAVGKLENDPS